MEITQIVPERVVARVLAWFEGRRLGLQLAFIAMLLSASCLFTGFYFDDFIGRYIYSNLPGAKELYDQLSGGYGIATGVPAENHWQIEQGWAPWFMYDHLLLRLYRPLGELSHHLDALLWPDSPAMQHLHNLVWLAILVLVTTRMYRIAHGALIGGIAATLFAFDHTHGFVIGYICNRHALITAVLGICALAEHMRAHEASGAQAWRRRLLAWFLYLFAMFSGESSAAIGGYIFAYILFVHRDTWLRKALEFAPYAIITVGFRAAYNRLGFGAIGSGLYIDPVRQPLAYLAAFVERAPTLILGQFLAPPAEVYVVAPPPWNGVILAVAAVTTVLLILTLIPLWKREVKARFWALGSFLSLIPAASVYPHNRQLLFVSFGAMALIALLFNLHIIELGNQAATKLLKVSREFGGGLMFMHLVLSPLALPASSLGMMLGAPLQRSVAREDDVADRDLVFVTAPDYFAVKLVQLDLRIREKPLPRRWRALAYGYETLTVHRIDAKTLEVDYAGGILQMPLLELYRDKHIPMHVGDKVALDGLNIEVLGTEPDGRCNKARFSFDTPLDDPRFKFLNWSDHGFEPWAPPAIGEQVVIPVPDLAFGL